MVLTAFAFTFALGASTYKMIVTAALMAQHPFPIGADWIADVKLFALALAKAFAFALSSSQGGWANDWAIGVLAEVAVSTFATFATHSVVGPGWTFGKSFPTRSFASKMAKTTFGKKVIL
jgi:hypothetical protein